MKEIKLKYILYPAIIIMVCITFHQIYSAHSSNFMTTSRKYMFFFKDSIVDKIDTLSASYVADQDILNNFIYYDKDNRYYVAIWEFNNLRNYNLDDVFINTHSIMNKSKFDLQETLNPNGPCPISIKYLYKIDGMILNLDENTKILKELRGKNYKGFYGLVDRISICNKKGDPQIFFNFKSSKTPTIMLLYKGHNSFYVLKINSKKEFDEKIIKILNLN